MIIKDFKTFQMTSHSVGNGKSLTTLVNIDNQNDKIMMLCDIVLWDENSAIKMEEDINNGLLIPIWLTYDISHNSLLEPQKSLDELKSEKSVEITMSCRNAIVNGFTSDALGTTYTYPSNDTDQLNLSGTIQRSLLPNAIEPFLFLCMDSFGVWAYQPHTITQIQKIGSDAYSFILMNRVKNGTLQNLIDTATTAQELEALVW